MGLLSGIFKFFLGGPNVDRTIDVQKQSAVAGLKIIYGRQKVTPTPVFKFVSKNNMPVSSTFHDKYTAPQTSNDDEIRKNFDWLYRVDCWGQGPIESIEKYWLSGDPSTNTRFRKRPYFRSHSFYGKTAQLALPELAGVSKWSTSHRGENVAYSVNRFYNSKKKPQFKSEPKVEALIQGLKVYDPRKDETNAAAWDGSSSGHRFNDQDTWEWSQNKVLIAADYLTSGYGQGAAFNEVDWQSWALEAAHCDEEELDIPDVLVNTTGVDIDEYFDIEAGEFLIIPNGGRLNNYRPYQNEGETSLKRYTTDVALDPKQPVVENMKMLLEGFGWSMPWSNGAHKLIVERIVNIAVMSFDENSIVGGWNIIHGERKKRLNRVTVEFTNSNKQYEQDAASWPPLDSDQYASYLIEDQNEELHTRVTVETISDHYQAQAYAEYLVRKSRVDQLIKGLKLAPPALALEPGDVIALTSAARGFSGTRFIVEKVNITEALDVQVDLILYDGTVYGAAVVQEPENMPTSSANLWQDPAPLTGLSAAPFHDENADGTAVSGFMVSWDDPESTTGLEYIELAWREQDIADAAPYASLNRVDLDAVAARISGLKDNQTYDIRLTYRTSLGQVADYAVLTETLGTANTRLSGLELFNTDYEAGDIGWLLPEGVSIIEAPEFTVNGKFAAVHDPDTAFGGGINLGAGGSPAGSFPTDEIQIINEGLIPVTAGEKLQFNGRAIGAAGADGQIFLRALFLDGGEQTLSSGDTPAVDVVEGRIDMAGPIEDVPAGATHARFVFVRKGWSQGKMGFDMARYWQGLTESQLDALGLKNGPVDAFAQYNKPIYGLLEGVTHDGTADADRVTLV
ncbi:MAG: hypothetical protein JKY34_07285, partial [Kordiimonadaceae bacterium]|nr:hypothetical protein [Kordiimonadaceae bacterium]